MRKETILLMILLSSGYTALNDTAAAFEWGHAVPEKHGMSSALLEAAKDTLAAHGTKKFLVIRGDDIVYEWYAPGDSADKTHYSASLAKAMTGGLSLLLALNDGLIDVDSPACLFIPEWKKDIQRQMITIRQLATHTSGIEDAEQDAIPHMELPGWKGKFWRKDPDPFTVARDSSRVLSTPGTRYAYSNPGMAMLSYAVTSALKGTAHTDVRSLIQERIMRPIGVEDSEWSVGYGQTYNINGLPLVPNWGGGAFTARAAARVGRLMMNEGMWEGKQLVTPGWIRRMVSYAGMPLPTGQNGPAQEEDWSMRSDDSPIPASGLCWYTNFDGVWKEVPRDAFAGAGAGNQLLIVIPSLDMILVRNGSNLYDAENGESFWGGAEQRLLNPVMRAIVEAPVPKSPVIRSAEFAHVSTIVRQAKGSDNWPLTWGDDDALYTAYGDGWGFEPRIDYKQSLGLSKVSGGPGNIRGENIHSISGERVGQGKYGAKASGMLMVDGVLYMVVRNSDNSQLAWSDDHGKNWKWCDWKFTESFGCPTFLNFGKNYSGARDNYVYLYSHDAETAYLSADRTVLARVDKNSLKKQFAYEYFAGLDFAGKPLWTIDVRQRGSIFSNPGKCYRSSVSYNDGLGRYLMCQIIPGEDSRFTGGFGIYDAPEPWGPWTTVFYTREWDVGPGDTCHLPTKWMSLDGKDCHLVFSGDDCFSVRKVTFIEKH